ncbi:MAG: polysaccharide pyruvyl transferase family protein [Firmicutes bacterium]|nr:polysaccharide pyruvyl transferase family protein [Bacillota bacterium]
MDKTICQVPHDQCTGCGACYNKCPVNAIQMKEDRKGFLAPVIDSGTCVHCGLCAKHCPVLNKGYIRQYKEAKPDCYAVMADDKIRKHSSSGGMFTVLAEYVLQKGGLVCGAAYSEDYLSVSHILTDNKDDLQRIRGSKYVQSSTGLTYQAVETALKAGRWVLYTGTPCQIAGIRSFLKKDYDHLILIDIVCHGVPSPKVYRKYIQEKARGKRLIKSDFRDKSFWGWGTATSFTFEDGSTYRGDCYRDEYWRAFLGGLSTRECCGKCEYANIARIGDFTIGDFWGVGTLSKACDDGQGTSLLLVNSQKAKALMPTLGKQCHLLQRMELDSVVELAKSRNGQLLNPKEKHWASERFFWLLDMKPFTVAFDYAVNSKYDVGVTGWWYNENYGGTLTYYALNCVLRKMGLTVLMIAKCSSDPNYKPNYNSIPYRFAVKHYNISKNYTPDTIGCLADHCQAFVSGSDQLFNPTLWEYSGPQYFLNYAKSTNKIVSYASSFGNEFYDNRNLRVPMGYWLRRFDALSVRESYGVDICKNIFGLDAKKVMDPVFLCDVKEYEKLAQQSGIHKTYDYLLSFFLDPDESKKNAILYLSRSLGMPYINLLNATDFEKNMEKLGLDNTKADIDIEEWLFYYQNADFVITDSFHGTCFAIIFRKKFISVANKKRGANRFVSLLEEAGLMDRLVMDITEIEQRPELLDDIDYEKVYDTLNPKIQESFRWLENAIKSRPVKEASVFNSLNYELERIREELGKIAAAQNASSTFQDNGQILQNHSADTSIKKQIKQLLKTIYRRLKFKFRK